MNDTLLSPSDLAEWLAVPVKTVYEWSYKKSGPPTIKVGRHIRYRKSDVEAWLVSQEKAS